MNHLVGNVPRCFAAKPIVLEHSGFFLRSRADANYPFLRLKSDISKISKKNSFFFWKIKNPVTNEPNEIFQIWRQIWTQGTHLHTKIHFFSQKIPKGKFSLFFPKNCLQTLVSRKLEIFRRGFFPFLESARWVLSIWPLKIQNRPIQACFFPHVPSSTRYNFLNNRNFKIPTPALDSHDLKL